MTEGPSSVDQIKDSDCVIPGFAERYKVCLVPVDEKCNMALRFLRKGILVAATLHLMHLARYETVLLLKAYLVAFRFLICFSWL